MAAQAGGRELILLLDERSAQGGSFPSGARIETVRVREAPTAAAAADRSRALGDLWRFRTAAAKLRPDVLFFPAVYTFFPVPSGVPALVTLHDAIAENRPGEIFANPFRRALWGLKMRVALRQATRIATVSEYSRRQIANTFRLPSAGIDVLGEGVSERFRPVRDKEKLRSALARAGLTPADRYLLYVGGVSPHKNLAGLVAAVALLRDRGEGAPLIICGDIEGDSFHSSYGRLRTLISRLGAEELVRFSGYVPDEELPALYSGALAVVLPSFDEGFCLPAAEAMACGAPTAAARAGALPDTLGPAAIYFDPAGAESIAGALARISGSTSERDRLRAAGLERAKLYRWDAAAERTWLALGRCVRAGRDSS